MTDEIETIDVTPSWTPFVRLAKDLVKKYVPKNDGQELVQAVLDAVLEYEKKTKEINNG